MPHSPPPVSSELGEDPLPMFTKTSPPPAGTPTPPDSASSSDSEHRARTRSRSPELPKRRLRHGPEALKVQSPVSMGVNGYLSPPSTASWRSFSRSPSPLGLIPIHKTFQTLVRALEFLAN